MLLEGASPTRAATGTTGTTATPEHVAERACRQHARASNFGRYTKGLFSAVYKIFGFGLSRRHTGGG